MTTKSLVIIDFPVFNRIDLNKLRAAQHYVEPMKIVDREDSKIISRARNDALSSALSGKQPHSPYQAGTRADRLWADAFRSAYIANANPTAPKPQGKRP